MGTGSKMEGDAIFIGNRFGDGGITHKVVESYEYKHGFDSSIRLGSRGNKFQNE